MRNVSKFSDLSFFCCKLSLIEVKTCKDKNSFKTWQNSFFSPDEYENYYLSHWAVCGACDIVHICSSDQLWNIIKYKKQQKFCQFCPSKINIWLTLSWTDIFPNSCHFFFNFKCCLMAIFALRHLLQLVFLVKHVRGSQEN